jgi:23S rRNA (cytidine1920-2'-O)/16S rRNA (cytidine1409-2'-O)-methyltransferase
VSRPHTPRSRLDVRLVEEGLAETRTRAQALVQAGQVTVNGQVFDKPGMSVPTDARIEVRARLGFVGRGALKLVAALDAFTVDPTGLACLDVGASTGGFTDALLQRGARFVYSVDVGRGQLAWALRRHPCVANLERTDIRALTELPEPIDLATVDVAFISLRLVLPPVARLLADRGQVIALVKPQFEAGRDRVGRRGLVTDVAVHRAVLSATLAWAAANDWAVRGLIASPITGASGNREFLTLLGRAASGTGDIDVDRAIEAVVAPTASDHLPT